MNQWNDIRYFRPDSKADNWGDASKMRRSILVSLDGLREHMGVPIFVSSGYRDSRNSKHSLGIAVDVVCPGVEVLDFYFAAERFGFGGIGVYGHWKYRGKKVGGLHLDKRRGHARWLAYKDEKVQRYTKLDLESLRKYDVV